MTEPEALPEPEVVVEDVPPSFVPQGNPDVRVFSTAEEAYAYREQLVVSGIPATMDRLDGFRLSPWNPGLEGYDGYQWAVEVAGRQEPVEPA